MPIKQIELTQSVKSSNVKKTAPPSREITFLEKKFFLLINHLSSIAVYHKQELIKLMLFLTKLLKKRPPFQLPPGQFLKLALLLTEFLNLLQKLLLEKFLLLIKIKILHKKKANQLHSISLSSTTISSTFPNKNFSQPHFLGDLEKILPFAKKKPPILSSFSRQIRIYYPLANKSFFINKKNLKN